MGYAVIPDWVSASGVEVADFHWLAYRVYLDTHSVVSAGMVASVSWVGGGQPAPVTERHTVPVTKEEAQFESWAAESVLIAVTELPRPPLEAFASRWGVSYLPPRVTDTEWAAGARKVLRWVTCQPGADPPLQLPKRHPDGTPWSAAEHLQQLMAQPGVSSLPETRREARVQAGVAEMRNHRLIELIDKTRRELGLSAGNTVTRTEDNAAPGERLYVYRPAQH